MRRPGRCRPPPSLLFKLLGSVRRRTSISPRTRRLRAGRRIANTDTRTGGGSGLRHNARIHAATRVDRATAFRDQAATGRNPELKIRKSRKPCPSGRGEADWTSRWRRYWNGVQTGDTGAEADAEITVRRAAVDEQVVIAAEVARLYLRALALDRLRDLAEVMVRTAEEIQVAVARKGRGGSGLLVERNRAAVEQAPGVDRAGYCVARDAALSHLRLAALWGGARADSLVLAGDFDTLPAAVRIDSWPRWFQCSRVPSLVGRNRPPAPRAYRWKNLARAQDLSLESERGS